MKEEWKDIKGYEGFYQISNFGRSKRLYKHTIAKNGVNMTFQEKILSNNGLDKDGYVLRVLTKDKKARTFKSHRLVAQAFIPNPDNLPEVNHINGIKNDNRVDNLEWSSSRNNQLHSIYILKNKVLKGEEIGNSKLTKDLVLEMRELKKNTKITYTEMSEMYGVNRATIHLAVTGKNWKHI